MAIREVAVVGLGAMGLGMALNLQRKGFRVRGHDVREAPMLALRQAGGAAAASPAEAAAGAAALLLVVFDRAQTDAVLFAADGALKTLPKGAPVVLHVTCPPAYVEGLAERVVAAGHPFVDAPVTGGKQGADDGTLTVIVGAADADLAQVRPLLEAMGRRIAHVGRTAGAGTTVKMINQLLVGVHGAVAAEAIALAARAGADPKAVYEVIAHGAGNSVMFESRVPRVLAGDFEPRGVIGIFLKDVGAVLDMGRELRAPLPMTAAAYQLFLEAAGAGWEALDDAALVKVYERAYGVDVRKAAGESG